MSDNIVLLEMSGAEETRRTVRVLKPRGSPHDSRVRPFDIESGGIRID